MAWVLKTTAILLVILCAASLAGVSARAASDAAFRQRLCLALAERIWPPNTGKIAQYDRNRDFLALGCLNSSSRILDWPQAPGRARKMPF